MKVLVLGHRGMLGHVVSRYLSDQGMEVMTIEMRYKGAPDDELISAVRDSEAAWIVNGIGKIKQKSADQFDLFLANAQMPAHLRLFLRPDQRLIHASTDCVFSGRQGDYRVDDYRDAGDLYGLSKILGEISAELGRCQVIRTSIIGPELGKPSGLMGWFLDQEKQVNGFTNHLWNGVTTLEWAKICEAIICGNLRPTSPILQTGSSDKISKCELLELIGELWPHPVRVHPTEAKDRVDRTLRPELVRAPLRQQIQELRDWYPFK